MDESCRDIRKLSTDRAWFAFGFFDFISFFFQRLTGTARRILPDSHCVLFLEFVDGPLP